MSSKLIFLIGFMGSGKSHTGRALAQKMNYPFFDLDEYIEEKCSMTIPQIFGQKGEDFFRIEERKCLRDFGVLGNAIIATGGGTPCFFDNMDWMNENGTTVFLKTPKEILAQRLQAEKTNRPLIANLKDEEILDFVNRKLTERSAFYEKASVIFEEEEGEEDVEERLLRQFISTISNQE